MSQFLNGFTLHSFFIAKRMPISKFRSSVHFLRVTHTIFSIVHGISENLILKNWVWTLSISTRQKNKYNQRPHQKAIDFALLALVSNLASILTQPQSGEKGSYMFILIEGFVNLLSGIWWIWWVSQLIVQWEWGVWTLNIRFKTQYNTDIKAVTFHIYIL